MSSNVSFTMHGIGVSGGIAIGHVHLFSSMATEVDHYDVGGADVARELRRYDRAVKQVKDELGHLADSVKHSAASELAAFVNVHRMLLEDSSFADAPRAIIREQKCNAEWALKTQMDELVAQFEDVEDEYLRERARRRAPGRRARAQGDGRHAAQDPGEAAARRKHDPGRARPLARGHDPVPRAPVRRLRHRPGRRHLAHGDRREEPEHPGDRRDAPLAHRDPRGRAGHHRRHAGRADRQSRQARAGRVPAEAEPDQDRAGEAQAAEERARRHARRHRHPAACQHRAALRHRPGEGERGQRAWGCSAASSCS